MKKYIAEFIGAFFLVLTIGCTVIPGAAGVIPLHDEALAFAARRNCASKLAGTRRGSIGSLRLPASRPCFSKDLRWCSS